MTSSTKKMMRDADIEKMSKDELKALAKRLEDERWTKIAFAGDKTAQDIRTIKDLSRRNKDVVEQFERTKIAVKAFIGALTISFIVNLFLIVTLFLIWLK